MILFVFCFRYKYHTSYVFWAITAMFVKFYLEFFALPYSSLERSFSWFGLSSRSVFSTSFLEFAPPYCCCERPFRSLLCPLVFVDDTIDRSLYCPAALPQQRPSLSGFTFFCGVHHGLVLVLVNNYRILPSSMFLYLVSYVGGGLSTCRLYGVIFPHDQLHLFKIISRAFALPCRLPRMLLCLPYWHVGWNYCFLSSFDCCCISGIYFSRDNNFCTCMIFLPMSFQTSF